MEMRNLERFEDVEKIRKSDAALVEISEQLRANGVNMDSSARSQIGNYIVTIEGIRIFNEIGLALAEENKGKPVERPELADRLEVWFMSYKEQWRSTSREGDLHHISDIIFWYADLLRGRKRSKVKLG
ncbi:hypothetical protein IMSAGC019_01629 [Lachnospiraceae bacterium]|nr:hypothetical protein IMSAGC019_01629 [Lachnospiraceae bacterium]